MNLEIASLFLILFAVIIIVWGIAVVHTLPGKIAAKRNHSQVEAIEIMSYLGLLVFPLWMGALIWAYLVPVKLKATVETQAGDKPDTTPQRPALTEIIALGQYTPYSKQLLVESRVLQIAPEYGGIVKKVQAKANVPLKKGDPLFLMDPAPRQAKVNEIKGQLAEAEEKYNVETRLVKQGAGVREKMINLGDEVDTLKAELAQAQFHLDNTQIVAPSDGYVVNLQLREGVFIRLKAPVMTFVDTTDYYLIAEVLQKATQWIDPGDEVEVALEMYPGKVFPAEVVDVIWASGKAQIMAGGKLPTQQQIGPLPEAFVVKIRFKGEDPERPLRFGAAGLAAIYTGKCDACKFLRQLEIRSESWLNYVYNPF